MVQVYLSSGARVRYCLIFHLLVIFHVHDAEARFANNPAAAVMGGIQLLAMLLVAAAVGGMILVFLIYMVYVFIRRYVFKIQEPKKNFVVDKKVKCRSGRLKYYKIK